MAEKRDISTKVITLLCVVVGALLIALAVNHMCYILDNMNLNIMGNTATSGTKSKSLEKLYEGKGFFGFWFLSFNFDYLMWSVLAFFLSIGAYIYYDSTNVSRKHKRSYKGNEHGSAKWATAQEMKAFRAKEFHDDFLLSENSALSIPALTKNEGFNKFLKGAGVSDRNKHFLVVGGSGSGKTFNVVEPNTLQARCSIVSTDPKGDTVKKYGNYLLNNGYKLKIVNIKDTEQMQYSFRYNPFAYIKDQASIMTLVSIIIENTSGSDKAQAKEDFWVKSERCLYMCLIAFLYYYYDGLPEYQTIPHLLDLIGEADASEQDETKESDLDVVMECYQEDLILKYGSEHEAQMSPEWFVITQYNGFKKAAGETAKSIIISCFVRLAPFAVGSVRELFSVDELELEKLGEEKTALFLVMSDTDSTFNFIMAMILYQLFDINTRMADAKPDSHCKIPIMCLLDEIANIGRIPDLEIKIATLRSRHINLVPIVQSLSQLDSVYGKEKAAIIKSNCDTFLYLGRGDYKTCEEISHMLGKETIEVKSTSTSRNQGISTSKQYIAHDLLSADEIYANPDKFADDECLVMIKLARPFKDKKYMLTEHPRFAEFKESGTLTLEGYTTKWRRDREAIAFMKQSQVDMFNIIESCSETVFFDFEEIGNNQQSQSMAV